MQPTAETTKGQVTIPQEIRQKLGIRAGSRVIWRMSGDHAELTVANPPTDVPVEGFGLLRSSRRSIPADFDPALRVDEK